MIAFSSWQYCCNLSVIHLPNIQFIDSFGGRIIKENFDVSFVGSEVVTGYYQIVLLDGTCLIGRNRIYKWSVIIVVVESTRSLSWQTIKGYRENRRSTGTIGLFWSDKTNLLIGNIIYLCNLLISNFQCEIFILIKRESSSKYIDFASTQSRAWWWCWWCDS